MAVMFYVLFSVLFFSAVVSGTNQAGTHMHMRASLGSKQIPSEDANRLLIKKTTTVWCTACEDVIGFLKNVATIDKQTLDDLVAIAKSLCKFAPYTLHDECIKMAEGLPDFIKEFVDTYLDPQKVCAKACAEPTPPMLPKNLLEEKRSVN